MRRSRNALAALGVVVLAAGCAGAATPSSEQLTPDGAAYRFTARHHSLVVVNSASGGNNREVLFRNDGPEAADGRACATWTSGTGIAQQGIAFRIRQGADGWRAVVLERNIWLEQYWLFVPVYFHDGTPRQGGDGAPAAPVDSEGAVSLAAYLGSAPAAVYPLRVCAQLSAGVLAFAVAKNGDPMVPVGTPGRGGTFRLREDRLPPKGRIGAYVAHVPIGTTTVVSDVTVDGRRVS